MPFSQSAYPTTSSWSPSGPLLGIPRPATSPPKRIVASGTSSCRRSLAKKLAECFRAVTSANDLGRILFKDQNGRAAEHAVVCIQGHQLVEVATDDGAIPRFVNVSHLVVCGHVSRSFFRV